MYDLIGGHVNNVQGGVPELLGRWKAAANVLLEPFPELVWLHGATRGRTVVRAFPDDSQNPDFNDPNMNPTETARVMVDRVSLILGDYPCSHIQMTNEPAISSRDAMKRMSDFDAECSHRMGLRGRKVTLANLATGNPPDMSWWRDYKPAIAQGMGDGAVLLVHAYTWPGQDDRWLLYRHRMIYSGCSEHGWGGLPKNLWIDLVIGEIGFDYGVVESGVYRSWRNLMDPHEYAAWLEIVNRELIKDKYVVGAAVFCCSNLDWKWSGYDVWQEPAAEIAGSCTPLYRHHEPRIVKPKIVNLVGKLPLNPNVSYERRRISQIKRIIIHHAGPPGWLGISGEDYAERIARYHIRCWDWAGIGYGFLVGEGGTIYKTAPYKAITNHTYGYNTTGLGVVFVGDFREGHDVMPNERQLTSGRWLMKYLHGKFGTTEVVGHKDKRKSACPGSTWSTWKHYVTAVT